MKGRQEKMLPHFQPIFPLHTPCASLLLLPHHLWTIEQKGGAECFEDGKGRDAHKCVWAEDLFVDFWDGLFWTCNAVGLFWTCNIEPDLGKGSQASLDLRDAHHSRMWLWYQAYKPFCHAWHHQSDSRALQIPITFPICMEQHSATFLNPRSRIVVTACSRASCFPSIFRKAGSEAEESWKLGTGKQLTSCVLEWQWAKDKLSRKQSWDLIVLGVGQNPSPAVHTKRWQSFPLAGIRMPRDHTVKSLPVKPQKTLLTLFCVMPCQICAWYN